MALSGAEVGAIVYAVAAPVGAIAGLALGGPSWHSRVKWGALGFLLPPLAAVALARRIGGRTADNAPIERPQDAPAGRARVHPAPVPVPGPSDVADLPEPVVACPDCGYLGVRSPGVQDGVWPGGGELIERVCPRCDWRGLAVEFARREEYRRFVQELAARATT